MSRKSKTLYLVNIDFPPISGPGVWRTLALAKYAAQADINVHVFCSDRSFWHNRFDESLLEQLPSSVRVTRIKSIFANDLLNFFENWKTSKSIIKRKIGAQLHWWTTLYFPDQIFHWALKSSIIILWHSIKEKPNAIFTTGPMHLVHISGYFLSKFRSTTQWIMDYRDPWTGDPAYGQVLQGAYQEKLMSKIEKKLINNATVVTAVSNGFIEIIKKLFGTNMPDSKFKVIPNGHDLEISNQPPSHHKNKSNDLIVHFNGTIQEGNDAFSDLIDAIARFNKENSQNKKIKFSVCGSNRRMREQINDLNISDACIDYGPLSQKQSQEISANADILLVTVRPDLITAQGVIPAKLYEALAMGKPILALVPSPSDVRQILSGDSGSRCVNPLAIDEIYEAIIWFFNKLSHYDNSNHIQEYLNRTNIAKRYSRRILSAELIKIAGLN